MGIFNGGDGEHVEREGCVKVEGTRRPLRSQRMEGTHWDLERERGKDREVRMVHQQPVCLLPGNLPVAATWVLRHPLLLRSLIPRPCSANARDD